MKVCNLILLLLAPAFASAQTAEEIMNKWTDAMGGEAASKFSSMYVKSTMKMPMGSAVMEVYTKNGGKLFMHTVLGGGAMEQTIGCDGTDCYDNGPMGMRLLEGQEKELMTLQNDPATQLDWRNQYEKIELIGEETLDGRKVFKLHAVTAAGIKSDIYIDAETYMMTRWVVTAQLPMGTIPMDIRFKEFGEIDGMKYPKLMSANMMNMQMDTTVESIEVNVPIPDSKFALPEGLK